MRINSNFITVTKQIVRSYCRRLPQLAQWLCPPRPLYYLGERETSPESNALAVIPPSEYWAMEASLNVSSSSEAIRYAAALFDLGSHYRYQAKKTGENRFVLIAYDPARINEKWPDLIERSERLRVTFAQWIFDDEPNPIRLPNGRYLSCSDGIVVEMDGAYVNTEHALDLSESLQRPRYDYPSFSAEAVSSGTISPKTLKMTAVVLALFLINIGLQIFQTHTATRQLIQRYDTLLESSHLSSTSIEREVILDSLKHKEEKQLRLREQCFKLKDIPMATWKEGPQSLPKPSAALAGIVLIPGSKPGEANQLLIDGKVNGAESVPPEESFQELSYEGNILKVLVNTDRGETLKHEFAKRFKKARFQQTGHRLEVRLP
ncbi:hypothetical protein [uncultured Sulfuricurvum sp.]|uniref:hypothetical protein n=1 Tax=uncultured Sulfuricurvum sp. TaxID=430693 RepID=UPI00260AA7A9|nr:hypothetical protein [uncultured Sulfuricurvum sp.]